MQFTWDTVHTADDEQLLDLVEQTTDAPALGSNDSQLLAGRVLHEAMTRRLRVPRRVVDRLLVDPRRQQEAFGLCVWCLDREDALVVVRPFLADPKTAVKAAWAVGCLEDLESVDQLLAMLDNPVLSREGGHVLTALSRLDTPAVRVALAERAATDGGDLWFLARTLRRLTGHSPLAGPETWEATVRTYWQTADPMVRPCPQVTSRLRDGGWADIEVEHGRDTFALDDVHPDSAGSWPLWFVAWTMGGQDLWTVGSNCGTCEVLLRHMGWAPADAVQAAQVVRASVADVPALTSALLAALEPLLVGCATGRYALRLCDMRVTAVTSLDETWYGVAGRETSTDDELPVVGPGEVVYTVPHPDGGVAAVTIVPTQPCSALDERRVAEFENAIRMGARPAIVVAAHATERSVYIADNRGDRSVLGCVVDGHHKLAAYDRLGIPARLLMLCDLYPRISPGVVDLAGLYAEVLDGVVAMVGDAASAELEDSTGIR